MCKVYHLLALVTCIVLVGTQQETNEEKLGEVHEEQLLETTSSSGVNLVTSEQETDEEVHEGRLLETTTSSGTDAPSNEGTPSKFNPRIVGGEIARDRSQFPFQASLRQRSFRGSFHFCGATIFDQQHLLTAAHCLVSETGVITNPSRIFAVVGDLNVAQQTHFSVPKAISNIFIHPHYSTATFQNDVAVVRVSRPFGNWSAFVNYLPLAEETPPDDTMCTVSGWGVTEFNGRPSDVLRYVDVPIVPMAICRSRYGSGILPGMVCAGFMEGGRDACQGDSGGPLTCSKSVAGIVSWGYSCAAPGFPGVYTDVASYRLWIEEQTYRSSSGHCTISAFILSIALYVILGTSFS